MLVDSTLKTGQVAIEKYITCRIEHWLDTILQLVYHINTLNVSKIGAGNARRSDLGSFGGAWAG